MRQCQCPSFLLLFSFFFCLVVLLFFFYACIPHFTLSSGKKSWNASQRNEFSNFGKSIRHSINKINASPGMAIQSVRERRSKEDCPPIKSLDSHAWAYMRMYVHINVLYIYVCLYTHVCMGVYVCVYISMYV